MDQPTLKSQLLETLEQIPADRQEKALELLRELARPRGKPARSLLKFTGRIAADDLAQMEKAIEEMEVVDPDGW